MGRTGCLRSGLLLSAIIIIGCDADPGVLLPARESESTSTTGLTLVARMAHISDTHVVDTESPGRFPGAHVLVSPAWRPYEAYSTQLVDGIVRTVNRLHAGGRTVDFLLHTGDTCDNAQSNELAWLIALLDGGMIAPLSGPDDRPPDTRPPPTLDPYAAFRAQGLYRTGIHGERPSIPWYVLFGNHDVYSIGVFPIFESADGHRTAPLPLDNRPGLVLPVRFDPTASLAYGNVTPAEPGPPPLFELPRYVEPNPARAFFNQPEFRQAMFTTATGPSGHGFPSPDSDSGWYSVSPAAGVRLISLDSTDRWPPPPGSICSEGAVSWAQLEFLRGELDAAQQRGELVIVASHHPTETIVPEFGSEVTPDEVRNLLKTYPQVVLHLAGHTHRNRVIDRGGYLEIETCSTLDLPQEGRLIELWRDPASRQITVKYEMFSPLDDTLPPLGDDPLRALRGQAHALALGDKGAAERQKRFDPSGADPYGTPSDCAGVVILSR